MNRKQFLKTCGFGCLAGLAGVSLLQGCASLQPLSKPISGSDILLPVKDFEITGKRGTTFKKYVIIGNDVLQSPICVYRHDAQNYSALWMQCSHQGAELQVFGDKLQCAAHGSEFSNKGVVENGPANTNLRKFPIVMENNILKISLQ
jgi:Rieske Fe-S protein